MLFKPSMQAALAALALVASLAPAAAQQCLGDGGYSCPAQDPVTPVGDAYDPSSVDWNALVADVYAITDAEPRICTMSIRAWFHDIGAHQGHNEGIADPDGEHFPGLAGSDASILTDTKELEIETSAKHGFAQIARHVLVQVAAAHGASHADTLTVFAAMCPQRMHATVDIPSSCEAAGLPLYVGKADHVRNTNPIHDDFQIERTRVRRLPPNHRRIPQIYNHFLKDLNDFITEAKWKLTQEDATALMGAHGNMLNQNCMTDGEQPADGYMGEMSDRTCAGNGGMQRMFKWSNHYWKDVTSGKCFQTPATNAVSEGGLRDLTVLEDTEFTSCGFASMEGFALSERLECDAMNDARTAMNNAPDGIAHNANDQLRTEEAFARGEFATTWKEARWMPDPTTAAPCCGYTCQTCAENRESKFWCNQVGILNEDVRFWPYGYADCDWNLGYTLGGGYCTATKDGERTNVAKLCDNQDLGGVQGLLNNVPSILEKYRNSAPAWEEDYAKAFCKMSNFGANYTPGKISLAGLFSGPSTGCLNPTAVLSPKQCPPLTCGDAQRDASVGVDRAAGAAGTGAAGAAATDSTTEVETVSEEPAAVVESTPEEPTAVVESTPEDTEDSADGTTNTGTNTAKPCNPGEHLCMWMNYMYSR